MGTNYYFFTKNKELAKEFFPFSRFPNGRQSDGAVLVDEPDFGYEIHLCKTSCGWAPLFENHPKAFHTFAELERFYLDNKESLTVYDEYGTEFEFEEFKNDIIQHSQRAPEPMRWVYETDKFFSPNRKILSVRPCEAEAAEIYIPFRHDEYFRTEMNARQKFGTTGLGFYQDDILNDYSRDPDYKFDWVNGTFS